MELFKIGIVTVRLVDIIDILVVSFLFYRLYDYLRSNLAIRVTSGILSIFLVWKVVDLLNFRLLTSILDAFLGLGAIAVVILFAPEIRQFLLSISKNTLVDRILQRVTQQVAVQNNSDFLEIADAVRALRNRGEGALIVLRGGNPLREIETSGDPIDATVSARLITSIFQKESPLHDGAMIIFNNRITAVRCILPLSENPRLDPQLGLRHRAALGVSEFSDALVIVLSEERNEISLAKEGRLIRNVQFQEVEQRIQEHVKPPQS
ncbi:MAG: diadenylate cyclase [Bacteroidota bacterium]